MSRQDIKTVTLTGLELCVEGLGGQNTVIQNLGGSTVYASAEEGVVPGADGVAEIPAGGVHNFYGTNGTVWLLGNGRVQLTGTDYDAVPMSAAGTPSGGSSGGADYTLPPTNEHTLGGMIVGDGLTADRNGRVSVNVASDEEIKQMLGRVFK